ncbi:MAG: four helix bundle protein [Bacteroidota bacterium]|nr:four helix bundle protein [Bacteroidota bacterium]
MHKFQDLIVYQKSLTFTKTVRETTFRFPKEELFGLSSQFKRAADSITLNIAEGAGNSSDKEFVRFLDFSIRSAFECLACVDIALANKFVEKDMHDTLYNQINELIAMMYGLQKKYK